MRITSFNAEPISEIPFLNAGKGQGSFFVDKLPIHVGRLSHLPADLDAIIATADLQGRERFEDALEGSLKLLGEVLPERLTDLLLDLNILPERTGILLAGDFYTVPNLEKRGGSGDVTTVWQAFSQQFKWVVGVPGNHDMFGDAAVPFSRLSANAYFLDGETAAVDGIIIAGIGGIVGNPTKTHRKTEQEFVTHIKRLASSAPDILIMHEGPDDAERGQIGSPIIRKTLERLGSTIVVRGHSHWHQPFTELSNGTQVLNVDCRVAIFSR